MSGRVGSTTTPTRPSRASASSAHSPTSVFPVPGGITTVARRAVASGIVGAALFESSPPLPSSPSKWRHTAESARDWCGRAAGGMRGRRDGSSRAELALHW